MTVDKADTEQWIGDALACASTSKDQDGTCLNSAIIIDDSDDVIKKPVTPVSTRVVPSKFRVPPAASLATPLENNKVVVTPEIRHNNSKIVVDLGKSGREEGTPTVERACITAKYNTGFATPQSLEKEAAMIDMATSPTRIAKFVKAAKSIKARSTKAKKRPANNDSNMNPDNMSLSPPTIGSTRKRRDIDYYKALSNDQDVDDSDEDYEYEEIHDDRRLNDKYDSLCPVLATPSKRQKIKL